MNPSGEQNQLSIGSEPTAVNIGHSYPKLSERKENLDQWKEYLLVTTTTPRPTKFGSPGPDQLSKHEMFYSMSPIISKESLYMTQMIMTSQNYGPKRQQSLLPQLNPPIQIPTGQKYQSHHPIKKI